jgi:hypothetical protein
MDVNKSFRLRLLKGMFSIARLPPDAVIPPWVIQIPYTSITRTPEELSIVYPETISKEMDPYGSTHIEREWRMFRVLGTLDFSLTGVLLSLIQPLGDAGVSIFAISTYNTDYLMVHNKDSELALTVLRNAGHSIEIE